MFIVVVLVLMALVENVIFWLLERRFKATIEELRSLIEKNRCKCRHTVAFTEKENIPTLSKEGREYLKKLAKGEIEEI